MRSKIVKPNYLKIITQSRKCNCDSDLNTAIYSIGKVPSRKKLNLDFPIIMFHNALRKII